LDWIDLGRDVPALRGRAVHVAPAAREAEIRGALARAGFETIVLEGGVIVDEPSFFEAARRAFGLDEDAFGANWDAFNDCLYDLESRPARRVAVLWRDASRVVAADLQTLLNAVVAFDAAALTLPEADDPVQLEVVLLESADPS
jgi:hypothetical protein